jgi:hypothetical protein
MERPDAIDFDCAGGARGCPHTYGYLPLRASCAGVSCYDCWNQEISEDTESLWPKENPYISETEKKAAEELKNVKLFYEHIGDPIAKTESVDISEEGYTVTLKPIIKDSGNRRQFDTGAVRDMQEGKGRCDLMPLEVVARMFSENPMFEDPIIRGIMLFMRNGNDTKYLYHALVVFCGKQYDGFAPTMLLEVAKHFEEGAKKYGENNWQKGIPPKCYIDSAVRHYLKYRRGDQDEPHDRAFVWNIMCCIWEVDYHENENYQN